MTWLPERSRNGGADEVPLDGGLGRLVLCGKHFVGPDPDGALLRTGTDVVVCLNERVELASRYPGYVAWLEANAHDRALWHPIPDLHPPDGAGGEWLLGEIGDRLAAGARLLVHCGAGMGRAGTLAAALLLARGASLESALATVADARPMAGPQAREQLEFLVALATRLA